MNTHQGLYWPDRRRLFRRRHATWQQIALWVVLTGAGLLTAFAVLSSL